MEWKLLDRLPRSRVGVLLEKLMAGLLVIVVSLAFLLVADRFLSDQFRMDFLTGAGWGALSGIHLIHTFVVLLATGIGVGAIFGHATIAAAMGALALISIHITSTMTAGLIPGVPEVAHRYLFFVPWVVAMIVVTTSWARQRREDMQYLFSFESGSGLDIGSLNREYTPIVIAAVMIIGAAALAGVDRGRAFSLLIWLLPIGWVLLVSDREERDGLRFFGDALPIHPARREWLRMRLHIFAGLAIGFVAGLVITFHDGQQLRHGVHLGMPVYTALVIASALILTRMTHFLSGPRALAILMALWMVGIWNIYLTFSFNYITGRPTVFDVYTMGTIVWFILVGAVFPLLLHLFIHFCMAIRQLADGQRLVVAVVVFPVMMSWGMLLLNFSPMDFIDYLFR